MGYKLGNTVTVDPGKPKYKLAPTTFSGIGKDNLPAQSEKVNERLQKFALPFESNIEDYLANNQGKWELLGKATGGVVSEAVLGTLEGASYLLDFEQMVDKLKGAEQEYTNWFADLMKEAKQKVSEDVLPVYETKDAQEGFAPGDATWWAKNTPQTIGTALSLMIPAAGVAGVAGKVGSLLGASAKGINFTKSMAATVASRYAESTMEANSVYEQALNELKQTRPDLDEEQIKLRAGDAASKTWNTNWVFALQDFMQYNTLLKGFNSLSKGKVGKSILEIGKQVASEAAEEAGQFITSEEALRTALEDDADYFGAGFSQRLGNYLKDPEFQASALLGAVGGGVFSAAGALGRKAEESGEHIADTLYKNLKENYKANLEKEVANYTGDTARSIIVDNKNFYNQLVTHKAKGTLDVLKTNLEQLEKEPGLSNEVRNTLDNQKEDIDFVQSEEARLKASNIPTTVHNKIIETGLEQRNQSRLSNILEKEVEDIYQEATKEKQLDPSLLQIKKIQTSLKGYQKLAETQPQFAPQVAALEKELKEATVMFNISHPGQSVDEVLATNKDPQLFKKAFQLISTNEKIKELKKDIAATSTPAGIKKMSDVEESKMRANQVKNLINRPDVTKKELETFKNQVKEPELQALLDSKINELNNQVKDKNKEQTNQVVAEAHEAGPPEEMFAEFPPEEVAPEFPQDLELFPDITPDFNPDVTMLESFGGPMTFNQVKKIYGIDYANELLEKLHSETPQEPTPVTQEQKKKDVKAQQTVKEVNTVPVWLKVKNENGSKTQYYDNVNKSYVDIGKVFATDSIGNLLIDTPAIKAGESIILKVVDDGIGLSFPYTLTPGFKPSSKDNYVINGYKVNEKGQPYGLPLFQLPSADNKSLTNPEGVKVLRDKVINSATGSFITKITKKSVGDFRKSPVLNSLEVLNFDYNSEGKYVKTSTNPILVVAGYDNNLSAPNLDTMKGVNPTVKEEIEAVIGLPRPNDLYPGAIFTPRRTPDGSLRLALLKPRKLVQQEIEWVKQNLHKYLKEGNNNVLAEVLYIPQHFSSFFTGTKKKPTPDILKASRRRMHLVESTKNSYELAIPVKNKNKGWIVIAASGDNSQVENFVNKSPFKFDLIDEKGKRLSFNGDSSKLDALALENIYKSFDSLLSNSFRNIKEENTNSEIPYTDPVTNITYDAGFYEFVIKNDVIQTDLPGSKTMATGEDSSYSVENTAAYLDAEASQEQVIIKDDEIVHTESTPIPLPESPVKPKTTDPLEEYYGLTRQVKAEGFSIITEQELTWFKENIGPEFLSIAKGVDRIIANGGIEAFGVYHNALVTIADFAETGTLYHEAFHFAMDNTLSPKQKEKLLNAASKLYNIKRSFTNNLTTEKLRAVDYQLRSIEILQSPKADEIFRKGDKNKWDIDKILTELSIPKEQKELIKSFNTRNREEILTSLLANYSYTVEINTAKDTVRQGKVSYNIEDGYQPEEFDEEGNPILTVKYDKPQPTQYYSNLTVPGGTNYTENEIATPAITPSIKGHAQFATDKGIGWFRSDEQLKGGDITRELQKSGEIKIKTRRILEVQSDLFQKGRDKEDLVSKGKFEYKKENLFINFNESTQKSEVVDSSMKVLASFDKPSDAEKFLKEFIPRDFKDSENQFLQLLNKDNNWVTFFVKSIIQDSAKKGYEKVLFPSGNTASKVEGHATLEEFKKQKEDRLREIENLEDKPETTKTYWTISAADGSGRSGQYRSKEDAQETLDKSDNPYILANKDKFKVTTYEEVIPAQNYSIERNQLKQELERVETEGFGALKPIYNFYENTVTNILKKNFKIEKITDEYGNTWNQVTTKEIKDIKVKLRTNVTKAYENETNDDLIEEELAEAFREYMLSGGTKVPKEKEVKSFFQKLWNFIRNLIGLKSPIERIFKDLANTQLSQEERNAIKDKKFYQAPTEKYRLLPNFKRYAQQEDAILATANEVINLARAEALAYDKEFTDLLANTKNRDIYFNKVKETFLADYNRIQAIPVAERSLEDRVREDQYKAMGVVGEGWDTVPGELQPTIGFKDEVIKIFAKWGFRVGLDLELGEDTDPTEEELAELKESDEGERVHNIDHTLVSPAKGLTTRIKLFLSTIPEPDIKDGKVIGVKKTVFGTPKFIDFNRAYANLSNKLAGSSIPLTKLEDLAKGDPISKVIFEKLASEIKAGNTKLQNEFNTKFNLYTYQYTTAQIGYGKEGYFAKTLETNRGSIKRDIISRWREEAVRKNLIETDGTVVIPKATALNNRLLKIREEYETSRKARTPLPYEKLKDEFTGILSEMGVTIPQQVWVDLEQKGDQFKKRILFDWFFNAEKSSLKNLLNGFVSGVSDPYENTGSLLSDLANEAKNFVDDITGSQFLNEFGNQVYATNTPSYLTEFVNKANQKDYSNIEKLQQDNFFKDNRFLNYLNNSNTSLEFISALRVGEKQPKDFEKRTPADSAVTRLTYYFNNQKEGKTGKFFVGTFSDKTKQAVIGLPKYTTTAAAYNFLTSVLKRTTLEEAQRIQQVKNFSGVPQMKAYKRGSAFLFVPELNTITGLSDSLFEGENNPNEYKDKLSQVEGVISRFIANEYSKFEEFLINNGLISVNAEGQLINEKIPDALVTKDLKDVLQEFFYNDLAWRIEMSKALMGDPAFYKSDTDYYKRQYQLVTPGVKAFNNPEAPVSLTRAIYSKVEKINSDEYIKVLTELVGKEIAEKYRIVNKTDAQSLITVHGYRKLAQAQGLWTKEMEDLYQFAWKDGLTISKAAKRDKLEQSDINYYRGLATKVALQPLKPFQYNDRQITLPNKSAVMIKEQFKDSMTALIPEFASRHTEYSKLLQYMMENQVDIMSAEDTCKVGLYGVVPNDLTELPVKRVVELSDLRFPQTVPDSKKEVISGTQFNKKITSNIELKGKYKVGNKTLTGQELINEWNSLWEEKLKSDSDTLKSELGLDESFTLSQEPEKRSKQLLKIKTVLEQQLLSRELSDNLSDALDLVMKNADLADFTLHLGFPTHAKKFAAVLANIFKKGVLKQKSPGFSLVNFADYGISTTAQSSSLNFITKENGELAEAEIGLPVDFFKDIGLDWIKDIDPITNKIRWANLSEEQKEALQMIAYRIPTSDKSSMVPVRVVMVIPPSMGNVVMVPGELTIQQGLDFDVDKTQLLRRVLTKEGKVEKDNVSNKMFNIAWGVLTNKIHTEEMLKPLASPTLKAIKDGYGIGDQSATSLLSPVTDIEAEEKNKHAKRMIGIFSRFSTAHDLLQTIKDYVYVSPTTDINIRSTTSGYKYNELGRKYDDKGILISGNISEDQSAALDAAKDPILADLNVTTVTAPLKGYLTLMGVNMKTISDFMMQPILREWMRHYNIQDSNQEKALESLLDENSAINARYNELKEGKGRRVLAATELENPMDNSLDQTEQQAQVLFDFVRYMRAASLMSKINNVLSVDTFQDMTGVEAIQSILNQVEEVTNPDNPIYLDSSLFDLEKAPKEAKRLAAFYKYGIYDALKLSQEFFPYGNKSYKEAQDYVAGSIGIEKLTNKDLLSTINNFMDFYMFEGNGRISPILNKLAPNYSTRWKFLSASNSIWHNIEGLINKYPSLKDNALISSLKTYPSKKDGVQMIGLTNTNKNINKTRITQAWWTLLTSSQEEIRTLGVDLIRFSIYTSAFGYNTRSFTDVIPVQFWVQNGLAEEHRTLLSGLLPNESGESATRIDAEGFTRNFVRHNFSEIEKFPEVYYNPKKKNNILNVKADETHVREFTLPKVHPLNSEGRGRVLPTYIRIWDEANQKYRLYESNPANKLHFKEVQPLGEPKSFFEISYAGDKTSQHPVNKNSGAAVPFNKPSSINTFSLLGEEGINPFLSKYITTENTDVEQVLKNLIENETNVELKANLNVLLSNVDKVNNIPVQLVELKGKLAQLRVDFIGANQPITALQFNPKGAINTDTEMRTVIAHELNHAYSVGVLSNPTTPEQVNFAINIERARIEAQKRLGNLYELSNKFEFVAALASDKEFRNKLRKTDIWSRILRFFRRLLGMKDSYDQLLNEYYNVIDNTEDLQNYKESGLYPLTEKKTAQQRKRISTLEQMISTLKAREDRLRKQGKKIEATQTGINIKILEELAKNKKNQALARYVIIVDNELDNLKDVYNKMSANPDKINANALWHVVEQLQSYDLLDDLSNELRLNPEAYAPTKEASEILLKTFDTLRADVSILTQNVKRLRIRRAAEVIKKNSNDTSLTLEKIMDQLDIADRDIAWSSRDFDSAIDTPDIGLQGIHKLIKAAEAEADRQSNKDIYSKNEEEVKVVYKTLVEATTQHGEVIYDDLGMPKMHWLPKTFKFTKVGIAKALNEYEAWLKSQGKSIGSVADKFKPIIDTDSLKKSSDGVKFVDPSSQEGKAILSIKKDSADYPLRQFYETVVLGYLHSQETIKQPSLRPGLRIPSIQRGIMEAVTTDGLAGVSIIKQKALDAIRKRYDETDFRAVDENGKPMNYLPIRFIAKQDGENGRLTTKEVSLDIATTVGVFMNEMHRYTEMEKILADIELIKGQLEDRRVVDAKKRVDHPGLASFLTRERVAVSDPETRLAQSKAGAESNVYKMADTMIRRLVYGQYKKDAGDVKIGGVKFDIRKSVDTIIRATGMRMLLGNIAIPFTNLAMGELTMLKEAVGGNFINIKDWKAGQKLSGSVANEAIADMGRREKKTKFGRVFTYFNPMDNVRPINDLGIDTNYMRTILPKISRGVGDMAEFKLASTALGAVMNRFKATNSEGKEVSLYEALKVDMDGSVSLEKGYTYKGKKKLESADINEVRDYTLRLYQFMNGNYNKSDSAGIKETVSGELLLFMRNWLVPGFNTRWQLKRYDERFQKEIEGHYISAFVTFNNLFNPKNGLIKGSVQALRVLTWMGTTDTEMLLHPNELNLSEEAKSELIEMRKANIRKTLMELYLIAGLSIIMMAAFSEDDDEPSYTHYMLARVRREMLTFINPTTAWDVLRSPSVAMRTITDLTKVTYHSMDALGALATGEDLDRYKSGPGKGDIKLLHDLKPILALDQLEDLDTKIRLITRGQR